MTEENKSLLAAVSAAVSGEETPAPAKPDEPEDTANEDGNSGASDDSGIDANEDGNKSTDAGAVLDPEGKESDSEAPKGDAGDGKPKAGEAPKGGAEGAPAKDEGKSAADKVDTVDKDAAAKLNAAINDPIDQRLKETTRDRIQLLANTVKDRDTQLTKANEALTQANTLFDAIDSTGMGPDELAAMLGYARARHHGTAEQKKQAYVFLKEELRALALEVGETDVVDFTREHQDLVDAVAANQITPELAREIAVSRSRAKVTADTTAATNAQAEAQRVHTAGAKALGDTAKTLAARDGEAVFKAKKDILTAALRPVLAQLPPSQWAAAFLNAYNALPTPKPATAAVPAQKPAPQPLRPSTPAGGGGKKAAKTLLDAVKAGVSGEDD